LTATDSSEGPRIELRAGPASALTRDEAIVVKLPALPWDLHREAIVILDDAGQPRAYLNRCKHLPVPLDGGTRAFFDLTKRYLLCGTHGALYERGTGFCVVGPCRGKSLVPIDLRVDAGEIVLVLAE
jgi:nitrite reductase/ring-hydroxylating ferredoxin subunit